MDLILLFITSFIWMLPTYLLAYLHKGKAWLKFLLGIIPIRLLASYIILFVYGAKTAQKQKDLTMYLLFVSTPLEIWYWINCYNLLKCNRIEKLHRTNTQA